MPSESRALLEDQYKGATVLLQFENGTRLDTCRSVTPRTLADFFEIVPGQNLEPEARVQPVIAPSPSVAPSPSFGQGSAGGSWTRTVLHDPFTDEEAVDFEIQSTGSSVITIRCGTAQKPRFDSITFHSPHVIQSVGALGEVGTTEVTLRADHEKPHTYYWSVTPDFHSTWPAMLEKGKKETARALIHSEVFFFEITDARSNAQIATFHPAGLHLETFRQYCGDKLLK